jgi:uncharacterized protein YndB with AHSA1/START domain
MLKKVLMLLVVMIAGLASYVALQPDNFRIERRMTVDAPPQEVFAQVNDFHKWDDWSPWAKLDPDATVAFEGPRAGQGAVFKWAGNDKVGQGTMTLVASKPGEFIRVDVEFAKPFEGKSTSEFTFRLQGDRTQVTWTSYGPMTFLSKAMCLIMSMEQVLGPDMEKGLVQMKAVAEGRKS